MKVALCCVCKNENAYIREWVEYYEKLGTDNIIIYDNNDPGGEKLEDVIQDYIDKGFVKIVPIKGEPTPQLNSYNRCIGDFGKDYDWIMFFDCDEYLCFTKAKDIKEYISGFPEECDRIAIHWMMMDDNDLLENDGRPLMERFPRAADMYAYYEYTNIYENSHVKTILKCGELTGRYFPNPHYCRNCECTMNNKKEKCDSNTPWIEDINWDDAYLKHFRLKTITEYLYNKILKGAPDIGTELYRKVRCTPEKFFRINKRTPEKEQIIEKFLKDE